MFILNWITEKKRMDPLFLPNLYFVHYILEWRESRPNWKKRAKRPQLPA